MLSPARHHERVPRDPYRNLLWRRYLLRQCRSPRYRAAVLAMCCEDCLFWINSFVIQYNPQKVGREIGPFITWPVQEKIVYTVLEKYQNRSDLLIEKSREMGVSWLLLIINDWCCLFHDWKKFSCISHSEQAVDKTEDLATLFGKVQFIHDNLPGWMVHARKRKLFFTFDKTHSSMAGSATSKRTSVGDRNTGVLLDEFAKQETAEEIWSQTADVGPRIVVSTHYGVGTLFFELCQRPHLEKLQVHWSEHPDKNQGLYRYDAAMNKVEIIDKSYVFPPDYHFVMDGSPTGGPYPGLRSPWYDAETVRRASARDVAMHLDIDAKGSVSQFFDRLTINRLIQEARAPYWQGDLHYDRDRGEPIKLVKREGGPLKLWCPLNSDSRPPRSQYAAGADISAGSGATPSCFTATRAATGEKVVEYVNPWIRPEEFAVLCVALCRLFRDVDNDGALFAWEQQGPGGVFGQKVVELGYLHIYFKVDEFELNPEISDKPGWYPSPANKRLLLEDYRTALATHAFFNPSKEALEECLAFKYDRRGHIEHGNHYGILDPSGASVNHADRVIADALAHKMAKQLAGREKEPKPAPTCPVLSLQWRRELAGRHRDDD